MTIIADTNTRTLESIVKANAENTEFIEYFEDSDYERSVKPIWPNEPIDEITFTISSLRSNMSRVTDEITFYIGTDAKIEGKEVKGSVRSDGAWVFATTKSGKGMRHCTNTEHSLWKHFDTSKADDENIATFEHKAITTYNPATDESTSSSETRYYDANGEMIIN